MSIEVIQQPRQEPSNYLLELDHTEALARVASAVTMFDPVKTAIGYLVPWIAAWVSNQVEIRRNDPIQRFINDEAKEAFIQAVQDLKIAADIDRDIGVYTSLDYNCSTFGGTFSLARPIISIPLNILAPPPELGYSPDEQAFFIARGLAHIKSNYPLFRIASKVLFVASIFFLFALHVTPLVGITLLLNAAVLYIFSERYVHGKLDVEAIDILTKYFEGNQQRAISAGTSVLQKLIDQNIERKERKSWWTTFYLTKGGNNLLDLDHPWLTTRLDRVREHFQ